MSGCAVIIHQLEKYYSERDVNNTISRLIDLNTFLRRQGETVEEAFNRYGIILDRVVQAGMAVPDVPEMTALRWITQLRAPRDQLP